MNRFRKVGWLAGFMLLLVSLQVQAVINYFWIFHLSRNLGVTVRGFGQVAESGVGSSAASMSLRRMTPDSGSDVPEEKAWSIEGLMRRPWSRQPRMDLQSNVLRGSCSTPAGDVHARGLSVTWSSGSSLVPGFVSQFNTQLQWPSLLPDTGLSRRVLGDGFFTPGYLHGKFSSSLRHWLSQGGLPLAGQQSAFQTSAVENILQSLVPVHTETHASDSPLVQSIPGISGSQETEGEEGSYTPSPLITNLLSCLFDTGAVAPTVSMFFSPLYNVYLGLSGSGSAVEAQVLVPHEVAVNLGMIPGANPENPVHMNPENWNLHDRKNGKMGKTGKTGRVSSKPLFIQFRFYFLKVGTAAEPVAVLVNPAFGFYTNRPFKIPCCTAI